MQAVTEQKLLTQRAAAEYLGVHESTLYRWRVSGGGPPVLINEPHMVRYSLEQLDRWLAGER